jgi:hypothetical protein
LKGTLRPGSGCIEARQIFAPGSHCDTFDFIESEVLGLATDRPVAVPGDESGNREALRSVLAIVPLDEIGMPAICYIDSLFRLIVTLAMALA